MWRGKVARNGQESLRSSEGRDPAVEAGGVWPLSGPLVGPPGHTQPLSPLMQVITSLQPQWWDAQHEAARAPESLRFLLGSEDRVGF